MPSVKVLYGIFRDSYFCFRENKPLKPIDILKWNKLNTIHIGVREPIEEQP